MILGIDPGTKCGWALVTDEGELVGSGWWSLAPRRHEGGGMRYVRLRNYLDRGFRSVDELYYEEVSHHAGTTAAHVYGGIVAVVQSFCEKHMIPYSGIPVGTVKKYATGTGIANKKQMVEAARERFPEHEIETADEADAIWIALAGWEGLG